MYMIINIIEKSKSVFNIFSRISVNVNYSYVCLTNIIIVLLYKNSVILEVNNIFNNFLKILKKKYNFHYGKVELKISPFKLSKFPFLRGC